MKTKWLSPLLISTVAAASIKEPVDSKATEKKVETSRQPKDEKDPKKKPKIVGHFMNFHKVDVCFALNASYRSLTVITCLSWTCCTMC